MVEAIKILAEVVDYPVTIIGFIWALRMIQKMYDDVQELLEKCLERE